MTRATSVHAALRGRRQTLAARLPALRGSAGRGSGACKTQRMSTPRVRDFHEDDLDQVVRIWEESRSVERRAVYGLAEVLGALRDEGAAVVAAVGGGGVGAAAGARRGGPRSGGLPAP